VDESDRVVLIVVSDSRGEFVAPPLPDGSYRLRAERAGFWPSSSAFYQVGQDWAEWSTFPLGLQPGFIDLDSGEMPVYPPSLKSQGIDGTVHLEVSDGVVRRVAGPAGLAEAAVSNISTWKYRASGSSPIPIVITYRLRSRDECAIDSRDRSEVHVDGVALVSACR
jgi:hypothetical protein